MNTACSKYFSNKDKLFVFNDLREVEVQMIFLKLTTFDFKSAVHYLTKVLKSANKVWDKKNLSDNVLLGLES